MPQLNPSEAATCAKPSATALFDFKTDRPRNSFLALVSDWRRRNAVALDKRITVLAKPEAAAVDAVPNAGARMVD